MAFGATYTLTVNAVAKVLIRVLEGNYSSEYRLLETTGMWKLFVRHSERIDPVTKETYYRHNVEVQHVVYAVGTTPTRTRKYYFVYDVPAADLLADLGYEAAAFGTVASSSVLQTDILNYAS